MPSLSDGIDMNAGGKAVKEIIGIFSFEVLSLGL
jgi:hypothetical protein